MAHATAIAGAAPAARPAPPPPVPDDEELVALLRQRVSVAIDKLLSDDPADWLAAELELVAVTNPAMFPTADGRWHFVRGAGR